MNRLYRRVCSPSHNFNYGLIKIEFSWYPTILQFFLRDPPLYPSYSPYSSVAHSYAGGFIAQLAGGSVGVLDGEVVLRGVSIQTRWERKNMHLLL